MSHCTGSGRFINKGKSKQQNVYTVIVPLFCYSDYLSVIADLSKVSVWFQHVLFSSSEILSKNYNIFNADLPSISALNNRIFRMCYPVRTMSRGPCVSVRGRLHKCNASSYVVTWAKLFSFWGAHLQKYVSVFLNFQ